MLFNSCIGEILGTFFFCKTDIITWIKLQLLVMFYNLNCKKNSIKKCNIAQQGFYSKKQ